MRRKSVYWIILCLLLSGCSQTEADTGEVILEFSREVEDTSAEGIQMQKKLAQWYNLNLRSEHPDVGFERSYESILFFGDGMLGYVELPSLGLCVPIYHEMREGGFFLNPYSAFPTGGEGNRTKLHTDRAITLEKGDVFYVHTLGEVLPYHVGGEGEDQCILICADISYEGTRMVED